jgi:hypothetical protein
MPPASGTEFNFVDVFGDAAGAKAAADAARRARRMPARGEWQRPGEAVLRARAARVDGNSRAIV